MVPTGEESQLRRRFYILQIDAVFFRRGSCRGILRKVEAQYVHISLLVPGITKRINRDAIECFRDRDRDRDLLTVESFNAVRLVPEYWPGDCPYMFPVARVFDVPNRILEL